MAILDFKAQMPAMMIFNNISTIDHLMRMIPHVKYNPLAWESSKEKTNCSLPTHLDEEFDGGNGHLG